MSIQLYQIGNVAFRANSQPMAGAGAKATGKVTSGLWNATRFLPNTRYQPDVQQQSCTLSARGDSAWRTGQIHQRLLGLLGAPTDVIGYVLPDERHTPTRQDELIWLHNQGRLVDVSAGRDADELDIKIEYGAYWKPLDRYQWLWGLGSREAALHAPLVYPYCEGLNPLPTLRMIDAEPIGGRWQFNKLTFGDPLLVYDVPYWIDSLCRYPPGYPIVGSVLDWTRGEVARVVMCDASLWGAPPCSVYALRNLPNTGAVTMQILRPLDEWRKGAEVTTLDLAALDTALAEAGYGGLLDTDVIYLGDLLDKPASVRRGDTLLSWPRPTVSYVGGWAGMIAPGLNEITVTMPDGAEVAWVHYWRRL